MTATVPARRVLVGGALRRYRETMGYALEDAARVLECDRSKISRVETGQRGIRPKELRELLTEYGAPSAEQAALLRLARRGTRDGWWEPYAENLPESYLDYLILESAATEVMIYEPHLVPDLLQTAGYARAIADAEPGSHSGTRLDEIVAAKGHQQAAVLGGNTRLTVVIGEGALHQQVGGPEVMAGQLALLEGRDDILLDVSLHVLPFTSGAHPVSGGVPLTILRFGDAPGLGAVRVPDLSGGHCLVDPGQVACHLRAFTALRTEALTELKSVQRIREISGNYPAADLAGAENALIAYTRAAGRDSGVS